MLLCISSAHAIHRSRACHVIFKRAHRFENSTKYRADDLCVNLVCDYFCWMLGDPHIFFRQITSFSDSFHHTKKQKNLCGGSFWARTYLNEHDDHFFIANTTTILTLYVHVVLNGVICRQISCDIVPSEAYHLV